MIDNWDGIHYCVCIELVLDPLRIFWTTKLYVFSSSAVWNNRVSTWFDWMSFWMFYREICKMRSSPCCSQYCPPAGRQGGEGFSCEEKQTGKKPSDFTFANARGKTHITAVFGFNFNRKSRSQATQSLKNKTWWNKINMCLTQLMSFMKEMKLKASKISRRSTCARRKTPSNGHFQDSSFIRSICICHGIKLLWEI